MTQQITDIEREAEALAAVEYCVQTNQGTYGATEACRMVGSGDPQFADRMVYETVGGSRRERGPDEADAPGYMRTINRAELSADRQRLADLRHRLSQLRRTQPADRGPRVNRPYTADYCD